MFCYIPIRHGAKSEFWYVEIGLFDTSCGTDKRIQLSNSKFINVTLGVRLACNLGNSLWDSNALFIISFNFCALVKQCIIFENCLQFSMPTLYNVKTLEPFWIQTSNVVWGVKWGVGHVWIKKSPTTTNLSQDFFSTGSFLTVNLKPSARIVSCGIQVSLWDLKETHYTVCKWKYKTVCY